MDMVRTIASRILYCVAVVCTSIPAMAADGLPTESRCQWLSNTPRAEFPAIARSCGGQVSYVGAYFADGKYRTGGLGSDQVQQLASHPSWEPPRNRPQAVPTTVDLHPRESLVENMAPRADKRKTSHGRSHLADWRDNLVTFAYGRELAFLAPEYVATDQKGRVIVSDPVGQTIHVLDGKQDFRIVAGPEYRLHHVGAVAASSDGAIFVADPVAGVIVEFDSNGQFVREMGRFGEGEGMFHDPAAIAIGADHQLYVADVGREMVMVVNLEGRIVRRAGGRRNEMNVTLHHPIAMAVQNDEVVVLDNGGARVQVFNSQFKLLASFNTGRRETRASINLDSSGNIYLSSGELEQICVFDRHGHKRGEFGRPGSGRGEIRAPRGLCIDAADRMYVADKENRRVDVFQISWTDKEPVGD